MYTNIKSESTKSFVWQELLLLTQKDELDISMAHQKMQPVLKFMYPQSYLLPQKYNTQRKTNLYLVNGPKLNKKNICRRKAQINLILACASKYNL